MACAGQLEDSFLSHEEFSTLATTVPPLNDTMENITGRKRISAPEFSSQTPSDTAIDGLVDDDEEYLEEDSSAEDENGDNMVVGDLFGED